jgi:2,4-dichlorophenol 6-monooxygenase
MTSRGDFDTDVLVVGTGPASAAAALGLATYGAAVRVVIKWWLANSPRSHITNQRALEVLRNLGVEAEVAAMGTPWNLMGDTLFITSLARDEVARMRTWGTGESRIGDYLQGSPCPLLDVQQPYLESVLVKNAAARGAGIYFNTEYLSTPRTTTPLPPWCGTSSPAASASFAAAVSSAPTVPDPASSTSSACPSRAGWVAPRPSIRFSAPT